MAQKPRHHGDSGHVSGLVNWPGVLFHHFQESAGATGSPEVICSDSAD